MKRTLSALLLISSMCYGQNNENYVLTQETLSNNKAVAPKTTYFNVSINKSASKKEFPSVLVVLGEYPLALQTILQFSKLC